MQPLFRVGGDFSADQSDQRGGEAGLIFTGAVSRGLRMCRDGGRGRTARRPSLL